MTETTPAREALARIIDPREWAIHDQILAEASQDNDVLGQIRCGDLRRDAAIRVAPSLAKADAILALSPPAISKAVEAEREGLDELITRADAIYERCKLWPERSADGLMALREMRNLWHDELREILSAIRTRTSISEVVG